MSSSGKTKNNSILVVDDESDVLEFLLIYLSSLNWDITTVDSTEKAFSLLDRHSYFLIITDIAMPDMDGYEFISKIQEKEIASEIALMTGFGYNPNHTLVKINKNCKYPILFKPFNRQKVVETVQQSWEHYHADIDD